MISIVRVKGVSKTMTTAHDRRNKKRHAIGVGECVRLRQHGREDDDEDGHDTGRVDDADVAHELDGKARGERGGEHVDQRIAEQNGADHLLGRREQAVDELRLLVAVLLERMHAGARRGGQARLAYVEECGHRDQEHDGGNLKSDL